MKRDFLYGIVLVIGILGIWKVYDKEQQDHGVTKVLVTQLRIERESLMVREDSIKQAYKQDTIRLTKRVIVRVPVIEKVTEYIEKNIPVPVELVKEVIKVDSQVTQACQIARGTCEMMQATLQLQLRTADSTITLQQQQLNPSLVTKAANAAKWMGIGILLYSVFK